MAVTVTRLPSNDRILTPQEQSLVANKEMTRKFGQPEDFVELHIYDNTNNLIRSIVPYKNYGVPNSGVTGNVNSTTELSFDPAFDIQQLGFSRGSFITDYNVLRPKVYLGVERVFFIKEISSDRLELRLNSTVVSNDLILSGGNEFINEFYGTPYFKEFYLNFGQNRFIPAVNVALDLSSDNYSILIKLINPLPVQFTQNDRIGIVDKLSIDDRFSVSITVDISTPTFPTLRPANFNIDVDYLVAGSTPYYNYNQITNITSSQNPLFQRLLTFMSSSTFQINVDYTDYNNFVHFSSITERLQAFQYKISQIELYNKTIASASLSPSPAAFLTVTSSLNSIDKVIKSFDGYENYLYFESSSYAWPKINNTKPYQLYSVSSSQVIAWYSGSYDSGSIYDNNNQNYLLNALPTYITDNSNNETLFTYVSALGQMFDEIWLYIKAIVDLYQAKNKLSEGISKDLVYYALQSFGIKVYTDEDGTEVFDYLYGVNQNGSYLPTTSSYQTLISASQYQTPGQDQIKSFYKRIYHNLPTLLKSKGTNKFADYLSTLYGIPNTILRPLEFGGVDKNEETVEYSFDRFTYALQVSGSQYIYTPWTTLSSSYVSNIYSDNSINVFEFRFKPFENSFIPLTQSLAVIKDFNTSNDPVVGVTLTKYPTGSYNYGVIKLLIDNGGGGSTTTYATLSLDPLPIFVTNSLGEYNWYNILVQRTLGSDTSYVNTGYVNTGYVLDEGDYAYRIYVKNEVGGEVGHQASGSITNSIEITDIAWSGSATKQLVVGGYNTTPNNSIFGNRFSGSLQELRLWSIPLSESKFNHHVLNPESFEGNDTTFPYNYLIGRFPLGNDLYTYNHSVTTKVYGVQPNLSMAYSSSAYSTSSYISASGFINQNNYNSFKETYYTNPAISTYTSPVTSKIDIVSSSVYGDILTLNHSIVQSPILTNTTDIHLYQFGFSPQDEINEDIIAQLGTTYDMDDIIGNPEEASSTSYKDLTLLQANYFKKYQNKFNYKDFETIIDYFHNSLFKFIQDFVPGRSNTATGLIYKPHILERSKQARYEPSYETIFYTSSIETETITGGYGGALPEITISSSLYDVYTQTGSVAVVGNNEYAYNGELSGSLIDVNDYYLFKNPFALQNSNLSNVFYTFPDYDLYPPPSGPYIYDLNVNAPGVYTLYFYLNACQADMEIEDGLGNIIYTVAAGTIGPVTFTANNPGYYLRFINTGLNVIAGGRIGIQDIEYYQPSLLPIFNQQYQGFNALQNNAEENRISDKARLVSYNEDGTEVTSYVELQDALYNSTLAIPRIDGTKTTSRTYNDYSNGDTTYGKTATIDKRQTYFAYCDWNGGALAEKQGSWNYHIKFLCNDDGVTLSPTNLLSYNGEYRLGLFSSFESGDEVNVSSNPGLSTGSQAQTYTIFRPGQRTTTILYTDTGSIGKDYLVSGSYSSINFYIPSSSLSEQKFALWVTRSANQSINLLSWNGEYIPVEFNNVIQDEKTDWNITNYQYTSSFTSDINARVAFGAAITNPNALDITCSIIILKNNEIFDSASLKIGPSSTSTINVLSTDNNWNIGDIYQPVILPLTNAPGFYPTPLSLLKSAGAFISQFRIIPYTGSITIQKQDCWSVGNSTKDTVLTGSLTVVTNPGLARVYGGAYYQTPIEGSGFDEPIKFELQYGDEIRFMGNEGLVRTIKEVNFSATDEKIYVTLTEPVDSTKIDINYFSIRRYIDDVGFMMINGNGGNNPCFVFPKYPSEKLKNNLSRIIEDLTQKGLIPAL